MQLHLSGTPICDSNSTVKETQPAVVSCRLHFGGPRPPWDVMVSHDDRKLSGVNDDITGKLHRYVSFRALSKDSGVYTCSISSQLPQYSGSCTTTLHVKSKSSLKFLFFPSWFCHGCIHIIIKSQDILDQ